MNTKAIADAIAGRFTGVTTATQSIAIGPTASLPNSIAAGPALLVFHPTGTLEMGVNRQRSDELDFPVRLLTDPLDTPRRSDNLYAWVDALRDRVEMDMDLGLAYVAWARPISLDVQLDGFTYAGTQFDMVELIVRVKVWEVVATVAV